MIEVSGKPIRPCSAAISTGKAATVVRAQLKPMPSSQETSTTRVPGASRGRSASVRNIIGESGFCSTQLTMRSCSARKLARSRGPLSVIAWPTSDASALSLKCTICTEWIGAATAAISRWVSTRTSVTPSPFSPVTAPRAVAPKPITTARRFGP